jgi:aminoglycoside phosphotransferase (APT) family kinase protein
MHPDELEINEPLVLSLIDEQFPEWRDLRLRAISWGTVNAVYRLGEELAVRLPRRAEWASNLEQEVRWLPVLAPSLPLPIPEPVALGAPSQDYPLTWAVYRWLNGTPMLEAVRVDQSAIADELAAFVTAMQRIERPSDPPVSNRSVPLAEHDKAIARAFRSSQPTASTSRPCRRRGSTRLRRRVGVGRLSGYTAT